MKALLIIGVLAAIADAASIIDIPNWVSWVLIGVPLTVYTLIAGLALLVATSK